MIENGREGGVDEVGFLYTPHLTTGNYDLPDGDRELQRSMDRSLKMEEAIVVLKLRQKLLREHIRVNRALRFFRWLASFTTHGTPNDMDERVLGRTQRRGQAIECSLVVSDEMCGQILTDSLATFQSVLSKCLSTSLIALLSI